jgi:hypothetical protein
VRRRRRRGTNEPNLFKTLRTGFGVSCENPFPVLSLLGKKTIPVLTRGRIL